LLFFGDIFMVRIGIKTGATMRVSWIVVKQFGFPEQGSSHADYTESSAACHRGIISCVHPTHLGAIHLSAVCRDPDDRAAYGFQHIANDGASGGTPRRETEEPFKNVLRIERLRDLDSASLGRLS
jgi:hypothetical protein